MFGFSLTVEFFLYGDWLGMRFWVGVLKHIVYFVGFGGGGEYGEQLLCIA